MTTCERGLNSFQLKLIALCVMILDHASIAFGHISSWLHTLSRFVSPLFVFLMVVGFFYTSNRKKYALRLWGMGLFVLAGNFLVGYLTGKTAELTSHTIILTLAMCFTIIWTLDTARHSAGARRVWLYVLFAVLTLAGLALGLFALEGGVEAIPVALIVYLCWPLKRGKLWMCLSIALLSVLLGLTMLPVDRGTVDWVTFLSFGSDWMQFTVIPFLLLYNGRPGPKNAFSKWMFYILYPAHLWIFALVGMLLGTGA